MQKIPLTVRGAELLKQELQRLKSVARPEIIEAIAEARSHGDLSENAEYEAAKEKQGFSGSGKIGRTGEDDFHGYTFGGVFRRPVPDGSKRPPERLGFEGCRGIENRFSDGLQGCGRATCCVFAAFSVWF